MNHFYYRYSLSKFLCTQAFDTSVRGLAIGEKAYLRVSSTTHYFAPQMMQNIAMEEHCVETLDPVGCAECR